jgi:signal transduction histidine kinase
VTFNYRFRSEDPTPVPLRLKVEVNTWEHFSARGFQKVPFAVTSRWFDGACQITTYDLDELMGTKLRALYQRRKGATCSTSIRRSPKPVLIPAANCSVHRRRAASIEPAPTLRDRVLEQRINEAIVVAREAAVHASRAKSRFLATANHELRLPLQSVNC